VVGYVKRIEEDDEPEFVEDWDDVEDCFFVTPDGEGRYYYDSLEEAQEQHGKLPVRTCVTDRLGF
jgi:hypothetical protein